MNLYEVRLTQTTPPQVANHIIVSNDVKNVFKMNYRGLVEKYLKNESIHLWIDAEGQTPMHWICGPSFDHFLMQELLDKGVTVLTKDKLGNTPLHLACQGHVTEAIRLLIEKRADPFVTNNGGDKPFTLCTKYNVPKNIFLCFKYFFQAIRDNGLGNEEEIDSLCVELSQMLIKNIFKADEIILLLGDSLRLVKCFGKVLREPSYDAHQFLTRLPEALVQGFVEGLCENTPDRYEEWNTESTLQLISKMIETWHHPELSAKLSKTRAWLEIKIRSSAHEQGDVPPQTSTRVNYLIYQTFRNEVHKPTGIFHWENCLRILSTNIALRHVSSEEQAQIELSSGNLGNALSLSSGLIYLMVELGQQGKLSKGLLTSYLDEGLDVSFAVLKSESSLRQICASLSEDDKELISKEFEKALRSFLYHSIFELDNPLDMRKSDFNLWVNKMKNTSTFLLIREPTDHYPVDHQNFYGLGKMENLSLSSEEILKCFSLPSLDQIFVFTESSENINKKVGLIYQGVMSHFLGLISSELHELT